jgi:hypothetical protein
MGWLGRSLIGLSALVVAGSTAAMIVAGVYYG